MLSKLSFVDKVVIGKGIIRDICYYKGNGEFSLQLKCRHLTLMTIATEFCLGAIAEVLECSPNVETLRVDFTNPGRSHKVTPTNADTFRGSPRLD
ncbi:hypothetical protein MLD38_036968 [Melastoma candidum]|uniref:Uncharacterized protein n=1 Tax=Melastoma candidum TaxID=119954 RepID=A0ACB9LMH5_9MYRT|nr:hypothetical protein MLD38_036968 [Melastoma candidum]